MKWTVEYYKDEAGRCHVLEFLRDIKDIKLRAKILSDIDKLEAKGTELKEPCVKHIGSGIWELRSKQSSNIARVLYFTFTGGKFVLLHGFIKKTMKTPPAEIEKARTRRDDYIRRFGK